MDFRSGTIYVYKSGWQYVGNGTLVTFDGTSSTYSPAAITLPLDSATDLGLYVRIQITEGNKWIRWVNLDWPIKAVNEVKKICFIGEIVYGGEDQEKFTGNLNITMPDGGYDWPYIQDGVVDFERLVFGTDVSDPSKWTFYVWNPRAFKYEYMDLSAIATFTESTTNCIDNNLGKMELTNPRQYRLYGKATKNAVAVPGVSVYVSGNRFWEWAVTNVNGEYTMSVPGTELDYQFGAETGKVHVDGTLNFNEDSDNGSAVRLDLDLPNQAPQLTNFYIPRRLVIPAGASQVTASVVAAAFDADSSNITFNWSCATGCTLATAARAASSFGNSIQTFTATTAGVYTVGVTVSDADGGSVVKQGNITVEQGNRAPRALSVRKTLGTDSALLSCVRASDKLSCKDSLRVGNAGSYRVVYSDADGDTVNFTWDGFSCVDSASCSFTASTSGTLGATLSDGEKNDRVDIVMDVAANKPPEIVYAFALPANILVDQGGTNQVAVTLEASAIDDVGVVSEQWSVVNSASESVFSSTSGAGEIPVGALPEGEYVATYTANDAESGVAEASRLIRIFSNAPPVITAIGVSAPVFDASTGTNDSAIELTSTATDAEGDALSYNWMVNGQAYSGQNVSIPAGTLASDIYEASLVVSDGSGVAEDVIGFRVNGAPLISSPTEAQVVTLTEQGFLSLQAVAEDDFTGSEALTYSWTLSGNELSATRSLSTRMSAVGSFAFSLTVTDADGLSSSVGFTVNVEARVNQAPQILFPSNGFSTTLAVDKDVNIQSSVTDDVTASENLVYSWSLDGSSAGSTGSLFIGAGTLSVGSHSIGLTVTDGDSASSSVSFSIEVTAVQEGNLEVIIE